MSLKIPANFGLATSIKEMGDTKKKLLEIERELEDYRKEFIKSVILTKEEVLSSIPTTQYHLYCKKKVELSYDVIRIDDDSAYMNASIKISEFNGSLYDLLDMKIKSHDYVSYSISTLHETLKNKTTKVKNFIIDSKNNLIIPIYHSVTSYFNSEFNEYIFRIKVEEYISKITNNKVDNIFECKFDLITNSFISIYPITKNKVINFRYKYWFSDICCE